MKELKVKYYSSLLTEAINDATITSLLKEDREVIVTIINEKVTRDQIKINKQVVEILSRKFGSDFGKFLNKRLTKRKIIRNIDLAGLLKKYENNPTDELYENIFIILSGPLIDYFISRTIGFGNDLRKITPFKKAVGTGNFKIDYTLYKIINKFTTNNKQFLESLKDNLFMFIDNKLDELFDDSDYKQLTSEEGVLEEGRIADLWRKWTSSERRDKIKLLSTIYDFLPKINKKVKRKIRDEIFKRKYSEILKIKGGTNSETVAKVVAAPVVDNFISQMAGSKSLEKAKELEPFYVVILKSLRTKKMVNFFRNDLEEMIKVLMIKKQQRKEKK